MNYACPVCNQNDRQCEFGWCNDHPDDRTVYVHTMDGMWVVVAHVDTHPPFDVTGFDEWLGCRKTTWGEAKKAIRPVPKEEEILRW